MANSSSGKLPGGQAPSFEPRVSEATTMPIVVREDVYSGNDEEQCYVLVDNRAVPVMSQCILSTQDATIEVESEEKGMEMVHVEKDAIEVIHMPEESVVIDDGETVKVVEMERNKDMSDRAMIVKKDTGNSIDVIHMPEESVFMDDGETVKVVEMDRNKEIADRTVVVKMDTNTSKKDTGNSIERTVVMDNAVKVVEMDRNKDRTVFKMDRSKKKGMEMIHIPERTMNRKILGMERAKERALPVVVNIDENKDKIIHMQGQEYGEKTVELVVEMDREMDDKREMNNKESTDSIEMIHVNMESGKETKEAIQIINMETSYESKSIGQKVINIDSRPDIKIFEGHRLKRAKKLEDKNKSVPKQMSVKQIISRANTSKILKPMMAPSPSIKVLTTNQITSQNLNHVTPRKYTHKKNIVPVSPLGHSNIVISEANPVFSTGNNSNLSPVKRSHILTPHIQTLSHSNSIITSSSHSVVTPHIQTINSNIVISEPSQILPTTIKKPHSIITSGSHSIATPHIQTLSSNIVISEPSQILPSDSGFSNSIKKSHSIVTSGSHSVVTPHIQSLNSNIVISEASQILHSNSGFTNTIKKPHSIITSGSHSIVPVTPSLNSNIVISEANLSSDDSSINNTIIISWPLEDKNTISTQTDPYTDSGPSFNMFFCTFFGDGDVQTQCDMPVYNNRGVGTDDCGGKLLGRGHKSKDSYTYTGTLKIEQFNQSYDQQYNRKKILKGKGPTVFSGEDERDINTDHHYQGQLGDINTSEFSGSTNKRKEREDETDQPFKKKRGRKRKKRLPSTDNIEEELQLEGEDRVDNSEIEVKREPVDTEDQIQASEVLKAKGYGLRTKRRLKKLSDMHYMQEKSTKKRMSKTYEYPCRICDQIFGTFSALQRHSKEEHDSTKFSFPCDICGFKFTRLHNLGRHKESKHGDGEKRHACPHCDRRFSRLDVLSVHIAMVHLKKKASVISENNGNMGMLAMKFNTIPCSSCDKLFSTEQRLKEHRQGELNCTDCSLAFECKTSLRLHIYKDHPIPCPECGKVCENKQLMYIHRQSHSPKYTCKYCNKGFLWKSLLSVHLATHTGERSVHCDICGKSFAHKVSVTKHKWQEHNENNKKYKCEHCDKSFVYKTKLVEHTRTHTGEKPYTCHLCPSTFTLLGNLRAHIKSVHGVYIHSIKSDGTTQTQLVKYKRAKKLPPQQPESAKNTMVKTVISGQVDSPTPEQPQVSTIHDQVQMSESFETEAAVYQIVYAYPQ